MRGDVRKFFKTFLFWCIFETNLRLFFIFQRNLGLFRILATSGIELFVTVLNSFHSWTNVRKIYVLDVVAVLDTFLYSDYKFL